MSLYILNLGAMLVLGVMARHNDSLPARVRKYFLLTTVAMILILLCRLGIMIFDRDASFRVAAIVFNIVGFALAPIVPVLIANVFGGKALGGRSVLLIPAALNALLTVLSPIFGFIFAVSPGNLYSRGPLYWVYVAAYISSFVFLLLETLRAIGSYQNKNRSALYLLSLFLLLGTSVQLVWPPLRIAWTCASLGLILYYAYYGELVSKYDIMTNLFNRRAYEAHLLQFAQKDRAAVMMFDADDFKFVNDRYGHPYGDHCLRVISAIIKEAFSGIGLCYRIGGDEFCVLSETTDEAALGAATALFLQKIDACRGQDPRIPMVSLGRALYERGVGSIERAVKEADAEMFFYKQRRKAQQSGS